MVSLMFIMLAKSPKNNNGTSGLNNLSAFLFCIFSMDFFFRRLLVKFYVWFYLCSFFVWLCCKYFFVCIVLSFRVIRWAILDSIAVDWSGRWPIVRFPLLDIRATIILIRIFIWEDFWRELYYRIGWGDPFYWGEWIAYQRSNE